MRIVKEGNNDTEDQIVADIRPSTHPDGVLRSEVRRGAVYGHEIATEKQNLMQSVRSTCYRVQMTDYQKLVQTLAVPCSGCCSWRGSGTLSAELGCGTGGRFSGHRKIRAGVFIHRCASST